MSKSMAGRAKPKRFTDPETADILIGTWGNEPLRARNVLRRISETRPAPPDEVGDSEPERFVPAPAFAEWIRETFISASGALANEEHEHLLDARIGVLWTNSINIKQQRHVLGTAEIPQTMGGAWKRGRAEQQMRDWFAFVPDFVLTFYAPEVRLLDDRAFCGLVEHELLHCAQAQDQYGAPKFGRMGEPLFAMRGHDVEEFVSVVRRYGATPAVRELVAAAQAKPLMGDGPIASACGYCLERAA